MIIASFFFAAMNVGVKYLDRIPAVEIVFFRSFVTLIISLIILTSKRVNPFGNNRKLLFMRGLAGATALVMYFVTLQSMPLASAVTIQFLSPIFTTILGIFIVRERVASIQWFFFLIAFGGVLVIQGVDPRITPFFLVIGVVSAFFSGLAYNVIRKLSITENPLVIVFYFPLVTIPVTAPYVIGNWVSPLGYEWLLILFVGVSTQFAQYFMTMAYQQEELSKISSIKYLGIVYALVFGYVLFGESFSALSFLGIGLVLVGVFLNVRFKQRQAKPSAEEASFKMESN